MEVLNIYFCFIASDSRPVPSRHSVCSALGPVLTPAKRSAALTAGSSAFLPVLAWLAATRPPAVCSVCRTVQGVSEACDPSAQERAPVHLLREDRDGWAAQAFPPALADRIFSLKF